MPRCIFGAVLALFHEIMSFPSLAPHCPLPDVMSQSLSKLIACCNKLRLNECMRATTHSPHAIPQISAMMAGISPRSQCVAQSRQHTSHQSEDMYHHNVATRIDTDRHDGDMRVLNILGEQSESQWTMTNICVMSFTTTCATGYGKYGRRPFRRGERSNLVRRNEVSEKLC
jgi:hypothetical protein